jgi:hypothetical protein
LGSSSGAPDGIGKNRVLTVSVKDLECILILLSTTLRQWLKELARRAIGSSKSQEGMIGALKHSLPIPTGTLGRLSRLQSKHARPPTSDYWRHRLFVIVIGSNVTLMLETAITVAQKIDLQAIVSGTLRGSLPVWFGIGKK